MIADHGTINGFDFRRHPTHHWDSRTAHDGVEDKVLGFDRATIPDTLLRANLVKEGLLRRLKIVSKTTPKIKPWAFD
jgi:hypothetical protein